MMILSSKNLHVYVLKDMKVVMKILKHENSLELGKRILIFQSNKSLARLACVSILEKKNSIRITVILVLFIAFSSLLLYILLFCISMASSSFFSHLMSIDERELSILFIFKYIITYQKVKGYSRKEIERERDMLYLRILI